MSEDRVSDCLPVSGNPFCENLFSKSGTSSSSPSELLTYSGLVFHNPPSSDCPVPVRVLGDDDLECRIVLGNGDSVSPLDTLVRPSMMGPVISTLRRLSSGPVISTCRRPSDDPFSNVRLFLPENNTSVSSIKIQATHWSELSHLQDINRRTHAHTRTMSSITELTILHTMSLNCVHSNGQLQLTFPPTS